MSQKVFHLNLSESQALEKTQLTIKRYCHETVAQESINLAFISVKSETLKHVFAKDFEGSKSNHLVVKLREGMSVARLPQRTDFNSSTKYPLTRQVCRVLCIS